MEAHGDPADAWEKYRQVITLMLRYRKAVEKVAPFSPTRSREAGLKFAAKFSPRGGRGGAEAEADSVAVHFEVRATGSENGMGPPGGPRATDDSTAGTQGDEAPGGGVEGVEPSKVSETSTPRVSNLRKPTRPPPPPPPPRQSGSDDGGEAQAD